MTFGNLENLLDYLQDYLQKKIHPRFLGILLENHARQGAVPVQGSLMYCGKVLLGVVPPPPSLWSNPFKSKNVASYLYWPTWATWSPPGYQAVGRPNILSSTPYGAFCFNIYLK